MSLSTFWDSAPLCVLLLNINIKKSEGEEPLIKIDYRLYVSVPNFFPRLFSY